MNRKNPLRLFLDSNALTGGILKESCERNHSFAPLSALIQPLIRSARKS
jgi:hypothetical protein